MIYCAFQQKEGLFYPIILLPGSCETVEDDAAGGDFTLAEAKETFCSYYGEKVRFIPQRILAIIVKTRQEESKP